MRLFFLLPPLLVSFAAAEQWSISTTEQWQAGISDPISIKVEKGYAQAQSVNASFKTTLKTFPKKLRLDTVELKPSDEWMNWRPYKLYQPNMANAPIMISHGPNDHWIIAQIKPNRKILEQHQKAFKAAQKRKKEPPVLPYKLTDFMPEEVRLNGYDQPLVTTPFANQFRPKNSEANFESAGYHAWHSRDMVNWVHYGCAARAGTATTAEYVDGKTYIYYDRPNDRDPHLIIDDDLRDGIAGQDMGIAFDAPWGGSDVGIIRDLDGKFHMISENWQPINAAKRSWDSPLASHMVSDDGIGDFKILEPAVDYRTNPTGKTATFEHPHWKDEEKVVTYEIHEPKQEAFGDWGAIAIGGQYYLVGDYDPADAHGRNSMSVGLFTSRDINKKFRFYGHIGTGHPDPDIMFADGKFYIISQTATDFVSDGPWVGVAKVRAGVDQDGDGKIDQWSDWQETKETYAHVEGFSKQVARTPAKVRFPNLPEGTGFQLEIQLQAPEDSQSLPSLDSLSSLFK